MAGHAQLKFVMTECSKTQIRLTGHIWFLAIVMVIFGRNCLNITDNFSTFTALNNWALVNYHAKIILRGKLLRLPSKTSETIKIFLLFKTVVGSTSISAKNLKGNLQNTGVVSSYS